MNVGKNHRDVEVRIAPEQFQYFVAQIMHNNPSQKKMNMVPSNTRASAPHNQNT